MKISNTQTHQPLLYHFIPKTNKPIIEFGMGVWSTELICDEKADEQLLVSLENDPLWIAKFDHLKTVNHDFSLIDNYESYSADAHDWGIVFVDHRPAASRAIIIDEYFDKCDYMIVHDTQPAVAHAYVGMEKALSRFKYRYDLKTQGNSAMATIVSNRHPLDLTGLEMRYRKQTIQI